MATILRVGNSEGTRRCDAKCHEATELACDCVCGGRYHGKKDQAVQMITEDIANGAWGSDAAAIARACLAGRIAPRVNETPGQGSLL